MPPPFIATLTFHTSRGGRAALVLDEVQGEGESLVRSLTKCCLALNVKTPDMRGARIKVTQYRCVAYKTKEHKQVYVEIQHCERIQEQILHHKHQRRIHLTSALVTCASPELRHPITNEEYFIVLLEDGTIIQFVGAENVKWRWFICPGMYYAFHGLFEEIPESRLPQRYRLGQHAFRTADFMVDLSCLSDHDASLSTTHHSHSTIIPRSPFTTNSYSYQGVVTRRVNEWVVELDNDIHIWVMHAPLPPRQMLGVRPGCRVRFTSIAAMYVGRCFQGFCTTMRSSVDVVQFSATDDDVYVPFEIHDIPLTQFLISHTCAVAYAIMESLPVFLHHDVKSTKHITTDHIHSFLTAFPSFQQDSLHKPTSAVVDDDDEHRFNHEFLLDWNTMCPISIPRLEMLCSLAFVTNAAIRHATMDLQSRDTVSHISILGNQLRPGFDCRLLVKRLEFRCADERLIELQDETDKRGLLFGRFNDHNAPLPRIGSTLLLHDFNVVIERFGAAQSTLLYEDVTRNITACNSHEHAGIISRGVDKTGVTRVYLDIMRYTTVLPSAPPSSHNEAQYLQDNSQQHVTSNVSLSSLFAPHITPPLEATYSQTPLVVFVESVSIKYHSSAMVVGVQNIPLLGSASLTIKAKDLSSPMCLDLYVSLADSQLPCAGVLCTNTVICISCYTIYYSKRGRPYIKCKAMDVSRADNVPYKTFPRDLATLPIVHLCDFRKWEFNAGACCLVMASVVTVAKFWALWRCPMCTVAGACGNPAHSARRLMVGCIADIDDGTDLCCCFVDGNVAFTLVGLDKERIEDRVRGLDRIEWNRYVHVLSGTSPQADLAREIAKGSKIRTRERRMFIEKDRPPPINVPVFDIGPSLSAVDGDGGGDEAVDDDDDDGKGMSASNVRRTISVKIKGGKMKIGLMFEKLAGRVLYVQ